MGSELLTTNTRGKTLEARSFNKAWRAALVESGVEPVRENGFHALRHHYASVLLSGGVTIRALADYLGHDDPGFTLRRYAHLMPADDDKARVVLDAARRNVGGVWATEAE